ncbi:Dihydrolipoamide acetyltransferase component of pyruvate dehydrogenase complex OS=Streptomyces albaduncus OX=68172 GN=FHS32_004391 PE=3 SV=1 [Streptomyces griseoloalbus]
MAQVLEFKRPDLGEGLTEAEIVRWLVEVGDVVAVDQPVVEVETAKAMVEVPCPYGGVVTARFGAEGTELPVGAPLLTVAVGETADARPSGGADTARTGGAGDGASGREPAAEGSGNVLVGYGTSQAPARRRRVRSAAPAVNGRPRTPEPVRETRPADGPVPVISPLVRRLARQNGLDLRELTGSGPDGLILRADVEHALALRSTTDRDRADAATGPTAQATAVPSAAPAASPGRAASVTRVPLKGIRGAVADKLSRSRTEIPDATCWADADATELMRTRAAMNAAGGPEDLRAGAAGPDLHGRARPLPGAQRLGGHRGQGDRPVRGRAPRVRGADRARAGRPRGP